MMAFHVDRKMPRLPNIRMRMTVCGATVAETKPGDDRCGCTMARLGRVVGSSLAGHASRRPSQALVPRGAECRALLGHAWTIERARALSHRRVFEIRNPAWGGIADEVGDEGAPDIVLLDRAERSRNQTPQPG